MSCLPWKVTATVGLWRSDQVVFCSNSLVSGSFTYQLDNGESITTREKSIEGLLISGWHGCECLDC